MARTISLVQQVRIASPCTASWDAMAGDDRSRLCHQCQLHVYNLSAMTEAEGEQLIREKEGRMCARIYQRTDGTILTQDCPVGLAKLRRQTRRALSKVVGVFAFLFSALAYAAYQREDDDSFRPLSSIEPIASIKRWMNASPASTMNAIMGIPCPPAPSRTTTSDGNIILIPSPTMSNDVSRDPGIAIAQEVDRQLKRSQQKQK